ncbi:EAL domain-containing protein [Trinickia violacea]|uniref:EAL domain-containing protein n=1 Tax=Trinickia violacea TaxID=2571746 RepID=A0A4P8IU98_9BURK|nr:EAL domain-containing protein [Trinickia violacea]QCP52838.1 EAL domain-containing protein [Trinickia violacea]
MRPPGRGSTTRETRAVGARRTAAALFPLWLVAIVITAFASLSIAVMSIFLGYVAGESNWSKGQKDAVHALERFASTGAEADYQEFEARIAVPLADRTAKLEMNKADPDREVITDAFLNGKIEPQDIDGMIWLYRNFKTTPWFRRAADYWDIGDIYLLRLRDIGNQLHALVTSGKSNELEAFRLVSEVQHIDDHLAPIEDGFSRSLDEVAHQTRDALILTLTTSALLLLGVFTMVIWRSFSRSERLNAQLRQSEERLNLGFEGISAGLWDWDVERDRIYHSRWLYEQLGYSAADLSIHTSAFVSLVHPDDRSRVRHAMRYHLARNAPYDVEFRLKMGHGDYLWVRSRGKALRNAEGRAVRMVGCLFDVSDRRRAEADAQSERELAEVTLASIGDAVVRTDDQGRVTYCNKVAERMLGRTAADMWMKTFDSVCALADGATCECVPTGIDRLRPREDAPDTELPRNLCIVRPDGHTLAVDYSVATMRDAEGHALGTVMVLHDVSAERKHAAELAYQATHDELTDLFNRREFERRLSRLLEPGAGGHAEHAVMFLDLDQFKVVNDTSGHAAGDELIKHVGATLKSCLRSSDILARLGGDEFGIVLPHCTIAKALQIADNLRQAVADIHLPWVERVLTTGVSIGVVGVGANLTSSKEVMKAADVACYMAKEKGRNRVHHFRFDDQELSATHRQMEWVSRVKTALEQDRFCLYTQKIAPLKSSRKKGRENAQRGAHVELLLRMRDEAGALVPPSFFIGAAERFNLMPAIDRWVIARAFSAIADSADEVGTWSINLSGASLGDERLLDYIVEQQQRHGISLGQVCFEITETAAITNLQKGMALINSLRELGCRFALDDFGAGMSSFNYLKHLHVDYLKIDGSFIRGIVNSALDRAIVQSINQVAHATGKQTIAEFVENDAIIECLSEMDVDYVQGYGVGMPEPLSLPPRVPAYEDAFADQPE